MVSRKFSGTVLAPALLMGALVGCDPGVELEAPADGPMVLRDSNRRLLVEEKVELPEGVLAQIGGIGRDWSGRVETQIWQCDIGTAHWAALPCAVGPDYVVIGGGAWADYGAGVEGALLTGSYPENANLQSWVGESKDHLKAQAHTLRVFAIGLKLYDAQWRAIPRETLRARMNLAEQLSPQVSHPSDKATLQSPYVLIGGGARDHWSGAGNLLTSSRPLGTTQWSASGKDHGILDPEALRVKAIGIQPYIPGFGYLQIATRQGQTGVATPYYPATGQGVTETGWLLASVGAVSSWNYGCGGRLLFKLAPDSHTSFSVRTKDHVYPCGGNVESHFIQIRRDPNSDLLEALRAAQGF